MSQIRFDKVAVGYANTLFKNITLTISAHDRIGIVGNNGCGKSTLLNSIAGLVELQEGRIISPKGLKFGLIEQEMPKSIANKTFYEAICSAIPPLEKDHSLWKVDVTLDSFKAPSSLRDRQVKDLSGGWQRLALIARSVLSNPDILLLDEPTNHLDIEKILVLERWLNEQVYDIPMISVSHDRNFLENCTNKTFFLRGGEIREYRYPYARAIQLLAEDDKNSETQRSKELKEMNRLKRSAHELRQIGVNNYSAAALKKSNQIAKRAEGIETKLTHVHIEEKRDIRLSNSGIHNKQLVGLKQLDIKTPDGVLLFHIEELRIFQGDRLVIFGKNGTGKSQFQKMLHRATLDVDAARLSGIVVAPAIKLGYIDQHMSHLPLQSSLHDYINESLSLGSQKTTSVLVNAGFPISIHKTKLSQLSPGQRARIVFLGFQMAEPNFYIMDEPTNHLDISGQEQLESEILEQNATTVLVSHDRAFTKNVGTKFFMIKNKRLVEIDSPDVYYQLFDEAKNQNNMKKR